MNAVRQHTFELVLGLLSAFVGVTILLLRGMTSPEGYIIAVIGLQISAALFKLKTEIHAKVGEKLEMYSLLEKIHDPILHGHALKVAARCKGSLRQLTEGKICDRADLVFDSITEMVAQASKEVLAIHFGRTIEHITNWQASPLMRNYYRKNLEAVNRGVRVRRIFVLSAANLCDPETGQLESDVVGILNEQEKGGIDVWYVWDQHIAQANFSEDLIVVDRKWVEYGLGAGGFCNSTGTSKDAFLSVNKDDIKTRCEEFRRLKTWAHKWEITDGPAPCPQRDSGGSRVPRGLEQAEGAAGRRRQGKPDPQPVLLARRR